MASEPTEPQPAAAASGATPAAPAAAPATPTGTEARLGGVDTYFARPAQPTDKALLLIHDIFGWTYYNTRLIADRVAREVGCLVVVPDLLNGPGMPTSLIPVMTEKPTTAWRSLTHGARMAGIGLTKFMPFMYRNRISTVQHKLEPIVQDLRSNHGVKRLAAHGYCWGGRYSILLAATDHIDVGIHNHPSLVNFPTDIEAIKKPCLLLCAEDDTIFPPKWAKASDTILTEKNVEHQVKIFPKTDHGFSVLLDSPDPHVAAMVEEALTDAIAFLKTHL